MTDLSPHALPLVPAQTRIAVLVDGDNVPLWACTGHLHKAEAMGQVVIRRVYADITLRKDWATATGYDAIHCASGSAKNHADIKLVIGALDLAHRGLAQSFLILSDDRDFMPLVSYLREVGLQAERIGKPSLAKLSAVDGALKRLLVEHSRGLTLALLGSQMRDFPVKASTGLGSWRAYLSTKPQMFDLTGTGQETRVIWRGDKA